MSIRKLLRLLFAITAAPIVVHVSARNDDGEWGVPVNTFEIPVSNPAHGLYLINIQNSYPNVDWSTLDRLYIPAGQYKFIKIGNLPDRAPDRPLIITNKGGQVRVGGLDMYYLVSIFGGSNWIFTGKYDPISLTGDANYPGHKNGNYASSQGTYGILVDDEYRTFGTGNSGVVVGDRNVPTTDFEISFLEICKVGFAGMAIKSDDFGSATMRNVFLHDNYIHDMGSEGIYLGSTQSQREQHSFENLNISNNRILRTGTEGLQAGQLGSGCEIHNNVIALSAIDWKNAFQRYQDNSGQINHRYGSASVHHNVFIGASDSLMNFQAMNADGDVHEEGDVLSIHNNFFSSGRFLGMHFGQKDQPSTDNAEWDGITTYTISNNTFRQMTFQREEIYGSWPPPNEDLIRVNHKFTGPVNLEGNILDAPGLDHLKVSKFPYCQWLDLNGVSCSITGNNNVREVVDPITFANFLPGIPAEVDYLLFERWANISELSWEPIMYEAGDYVTHHSTIYQALVPNTGVLPYADFTGVWEEIGEPVDDVRLACDSAHQGVGLMDTLDNCGDGQTGGVRGNRGKLGRGHGFAFGREKERGDSNSLDQSSDEYSSSSSSDE